VIHGLSTDDTAVSRVFDSDTAEMFRLAAWSRTQWLFRLAWRAYERAADLEPRATSAREKLTLARDLMTAIAPRPAAPRP